MTNQRNQRNNRKWDKENFNKLPQLDRIEYRQREDKIYNPGNLVTLQMMWLYIGILFYWLLVILIASTAYGRSVVIFLLKELIVITKLWITVIIFSAIIDIVLRYFSWLQRKKLNEEYLDMIEKVEKSRNKRSKVRKASWRRLGR